MNELVLIGAVACCLSFGVSGLIDHAIKTMPWVQRLDQMLYQIARRFSPR